MTQKPDWEELADTAEQGCAYALAAIGIGICWLIIAVAVLRWTKTI